MEIFIDELLLGTTILLVFFKPFCSGVCTSECYLVVWDWMPWYLYASGSNSSTPSSSLCRNTPEYSGYNSSIWDNELYSSSMLALYRARPCSTVVLTPANSTRHRPPNTYSISDCIHSLDLQRIGVLQCSSVPVSPVRLRESQMVYFDVTFLIFVMSPMKRLQ